MKNLRHQGKKIKKMI